MVKNLTHIMTFKPDGTASCLWTDAIPLETFGGLEVHRASFIEFDNEKQRWGVRFAGEKEVRFWSMGRAECLAWEVRELTV